ncbi:MAG: arginine--tRNA ligase [Actinobacteria bacterium]|nr:arginine--tRNA ligase [Actinomycetota bacterium]
MVTDVLKEMMNAALSAAAVDGAIALEAMPPVEFERPRKREHGDWSTNVALAAGRGGDNPRAIAQALIDRLPPSDMVESVEIAGPGFLNFRLAPKWLHDVVFRASDPKSGFGRTDEGAGIKVNVEYVSANPTGPISVVGGRHAAVGDALSNLLEATGHEVVREYYVNDAGRQIRLFARSLSVRYLEQFGVPGEIPEDGYQGEYVIVLARRLAEELGDRLVHASEEERDATMRRIGLERMLAEMRATLERFGTHHQVWFLESSLQESGATRSAIEKLGAGGWVEERDGARWFLSSRLGDDKDRVLVRSSGEPTYLASDSAYLLDKSRRGFDRLIYILGAGHHGTVPRWLAAAEALGIDRSRVEMPLIQNISLVRAGVTVRASKRAGNVVPLDELVDEVGVDAARYNFLNRSLESPLEFDIDLVKQQAPENPVYYVQYAHARISSILKKAEEKALRVQDAELGMLTHEREDSLMRKLAAYEETVPDAAHRRAPQRLTRYIEELATDFSAFYRDCKVVTDDQQLSKARLRLCLATKSVLADGLSILGVSAPERM